LAAWVCALVAIVNAATWSVISPPFQLPDEPSHFAYVEHLAETGHLPSSAEEKYSPAEREALSYLLYGQVRFSDESHTIASQAEQLSLERALAVPLSRSEPGDAGVAAAEPPLYYALETVPYLLGSGGTLLDSLALMRLFSALLGGLTALFAFLFLRETLPGAPWAWTVGGLGVALTPTLAMMSGAVNPDALLFTVSTALFYSLARAFRRGLTLRSASAVGVLIALGCLTKLIFIGLVPGAVLALLILTIREARAHGRSSYRMLMLAVAIASIPACLYLIDDAASGGVTLHTLSGATFNGPHRSILQTISYIWQMYLPRLPGMRPAFHGISGPAVWFEQVVGKYGWLDTTFPAWVVKVALVPAALIAALFVWALARSRSAMLTRRWELTAYAVMSLGVLVVIGHQDDSSSVPHEYLQLRYVLPMIALMGAVLALAARGAGRRWGPLAGTCIVLLVLAHDLFSQLLVISRYYG
jgi:4-amino-4-deoxy-L-arabinose transferase-like glycosyltransferase